MWRLLLPLLLAGGRSGREAEVLFILELVLAIDGLERQAQHAHVRPGHMTSYLDESKMNICGMR